MKIKTNHIDNLSIYILKLKLTIQTKCLFSEKGQNVCFLKI